MLKHVQNILGYKKNQVLEQKVLELQSQVDAVSRSQAIIKFEMDGTIIWANDNFLEAMGYQLNEVVGQHHRMFVESEYGKGQEYSDFWDSLNHGRFQAAEYCRVGKNGKLVWIQATYNPIFDDIGRPYQVIKYATDITAQKQRDIDFQCQIDAINKSQAVIEFDLDGTIQQANENFLNAMGYRLDEVQGKHHRMFVDNDYASSEEYHEFWRSLNRGEFQTGEYKRLAKSGRQIWIQATYSPILGIDGKPIKVVKYATDISEQKLRNANFEGQISAISKAQAVIEFETDGTIITANDNFLGAMGYSLEEVKGKHHRMFVEPAYEQSAEYREFWQRLGRGEYQVAEYKRLGKGGKEIWIQASYNPIMDVEGNTIKVVKYATDITEQKLKNAFYQGQIAAIGKSQAVIEFNMDGTIKNANENFLMAMGYSLPEIKDKHHRMFVDPEYANSHEYHNFWQNLREGKFQTGEYKRLAKGGKEVWIQASYNPIFDLNGKPVRVVKYATEVTEEKTKNAFYEGQIAAIGKSQAVIEFDVEGIILDANENFLQTMGYSLPEIKGKHHRMFVESAVANSAQYKTFWSDLRTGQFQQAEYKRVGKGGKSVWIQASYNPILDLNGSVYKVVKYATDITPRKTAVENIRRVLLEMAEGDFTQRLCDDIDKDFVDIKEALNASLERLQSSLESIHNSSGIIGKCAGEISSGVMELSGRSEQQAASVEETAANMDEMTGTVRTSSDNASEMNTMAHDATETAKNGRQVVVSMISAMDEISSSSGKIAAITSAIDEIAFQTNLLALNAAVEAARAGEQGRGFAVVASEVRNLAQRSATSAKEISDLIKESIEKVKNGTDMAEHCGETLEQVVTSISQVSGKVEEISSALQEQAGGISQVSSAISQMDQFAQQNAQMVEEASSASKSLEEQSKIMNGALSFFRISS